jgi:hypothetical protein
VGAQRNLNEGQVSCVWIIPGNGGFLLADAVALPSVGTYRQLITISEQTAVPDQTPVWMKEGLSRHRERPLSLNSTDYQ